MVIYVFFKIDFGLQTATLLNGIQQRCHTPTCSDTAFFYFCQAVFVEMELHTATAVLSVVQCCTSAISSLLLVSYLSNTEGHFHITVTVVHCSYQVFDCI